MRILRRGHSTAIIVLPLFIAGVCLLIERKVIADSPISADEPPAPAREFRGVWVATVKNIDWPSRPGLSGDEQQRELIKILDKCVDLNLNAVILQIRTEADALYA